MNLLDIALECAKEGHVDNINKHILLDFERISNQRALNLSMAHARIHLLETKLNTKDKQDATPPTI
jgi:hypothetical protein